MECALLYHVKCLAPPAQAIQRTCHRPQLLESAAFRNKIAATNDVRVRLYRINYGLVWFKVISSRIISGEFAVDKVSNKQVK